MINPFLDINWHPDRRALRKFAVVLLIGLLLSALITVLAGKVPAAEMLLYAALLPLFGITFPLLMRPLYYLWFALGGTIGLVISNTVLIFFYYTLFTFYAGILRFTGKTVKFAEPGWKECQESPAERYFRQY